MVPSKTQDSLDDSQLGAMVCFLRWYRSGLFPFKQLSIHCPAPQEQEYYNQKLCNFLEFSHNNPSLRLRLYCERWEFWVCLDKLEFVGCCEAIGIILNGSSVSGLEPKSYTSRSASEDSPENFKKYSNRVGYLTICHTLIFISQYIYLYTYIQFTEWSSTHTMNKREI